MISFPSIALSSKWPLPIRDVLRVDAELVCMALGRYLMVEQRLANAGSRDLEAGHSVDGVNCQAEAIRLVLHGQFQWRIYVPFLLVATHVDVALARAAVCEPVNQPWIGMEVKEDRLVRCENGLELPIRQAKRMFGAGHQFEEVHHVYEPYLNVGEMLAEQSAGGQRLHGWAI